MPTVKLKDGSSVQVELDALKEFLEKNREQVLIQKTKMGRRRVETSLPASSK